MRPSFGFPAHVVYGGVNLTVYENAGLCADNYGRIYEYTDRELILATATGRIIIEGENFVIAETDCRTLKLKGRIGSIKYEYGGGEKSC